MRLALLGILCTIQACGDDSAPASPSPSNTPAPSASSTSSEPTAPNGRTAGTCGSTTSSVSFGSADDATSNVPKESIDGLVVDGDALYVAGSRFETDASAWVAKLDAHRTTTWSKIGAPRSLATTIALAGHDSLVVGGHTTSDAFVAKMDAATGTETWRKTFRATKENVANEVTAVAVKGNVIFVVGGFMGTVAFGSTSLTPDGQSDYFVARLDLDGNVVSAFKGGRPGADNALASGVAFAPDGDIVVVGAATSGTISDGFVAKYSPAGELRWGKLTGATNGQLFGVTTDAAGNVYVAGVSDGKGGVRELDAKGNEIWAKTWGKSTPDRAVTAFSVEVAADGSVLVGGMSMSPAAVDFGGGAIGGGFEPAAFIVELDASGAHRCSRAYPTKSMAPAGGGAVNAGAATSAVAYTSATSYVAAGAFAGTLDVGKGPMTSAAGYDVFTADFKR